MKRHNNSLFLFTASMGLFLLAGLANAQSIEWTCPLNVGQINWASDVALDSRPSQQSAYVVGYVQSPDNGSDIVLAKITAGGALDWMRQVGSADFDTPYGVTCDGLGNVFVAGVTSGDLQGTNQGGEDAFLLKYSTAGDLIWTRQFGSVGAETTARDVVPDGQGGVYVAGMTMGSLGGHVNQGDYDLFVTRYNADGEQAWATMFGTDDYEEVWGAAADGHGGLYVTGPTYGSLAKENVGGSDAYLARLDSDGALAWTAQIGTYQGETAHGVAADGLGNVFVAGATGGSLGGMNQGHNDAFLAKFDSEGHFDSAMQFGTPTWDGAWDVAADGQGGAYVAGYTEGSLGDPTLDPDDAFVAKCGADGTLDWATPFGGGVDGSATGIAHDGRGGVFACGWADSPSGDPALAQAFLVKIHDAAAVPEPGTLVLLALGGLMLLARRGR